MNRKSILEKVEASQLPYIDEDGDKYYAIPTNIVVNLVNDLCDKYENKTCKFCTKLDETGYCEVVKTKPSLDFSCDECKT